MTPQLCQEWAAAKGFTWYGTRRSIECYGGVEEPSARVEAPGQCVELCAGDPGYMCGGPAHMSLYHREWIEAGAVLLLNCEIMFVHRNTTSNRPSLISCTHTTTLHTLRFSPPGGAASETRLVDANHLKFLGCVADDDDSLSPSAARFKGVWGARYSSAVEFAVARGQQYLALARTGNEG